MVSSEINCPHCKKVFKIDETGYADILKQVKDEAFQSELEERMKLAAKEKVIEIELAEQKFKTEKQILQTKLEASNDQKDLAIAEAKRSLEKDLYLISSELKQLKTNSEINQKLAINEAIDDLRNIHEVELKDRDDEIKRLRDYKSKLSTKMIGESLEEHCETAFNSIRARSYPHAYFEKDNDISSGSKGDYIFRDFSTENIELISIMFEMKNEDEATAKKKKNQDFLKELDKDRNEKGCEYAVLVSMLEPNNDLYNEGIYEVPPYYYQKMYIIRPQFFLVLISLLSNMAKNSINYKLELALAKEQNIDITNFQNDIDTIKERFSRNFDLSTRQSNNAIEEIDKSIKHLEKTKEFLQKSNNNLRLANEKLQEVNVKKLTANNPTMAEKFADLNKQ